MSIEFVVTFILCSFSYVLGFLSGRTAWFNENGWKDGLGSRYQGDVFANSIRARGDE